MCNVVWYPISQIPQRLDPEDISVKVYLTVVWNCAHRFAGELSETLPQVVEADYIFDEDDFEFHWYGDEWVTVKDYNEHYAHWNGIHTPIELKAWAYHIIPPPYQGE